MDYDKFRDWLILWIPAFAGMDEVGPYSVFRYSELGFILITFIVIGNGAGGFLTRPYVRNLSPDSEM